MIIRLDDLPQDGRHYEFGKENKDLSDSLKALVAGEKILFDFSILPAGDTYLIQGNLKTQIPQTCSRCTVDFKFEISQSLKDIILVESEQTSTHSFDPSQQMDVFEIKEPLFNVSDFVLEQITLTVPVKPLHAPDCKGLCVCGKDLNVEGCVCPRDESFEKENAFSLLKSLKMN